MSILLANNIEKSFGKVKVLDGIDLEIKPGNSIAIMGKSGEGKTTLLHILAAMESKDKGQLEINGNKITLQNGCKIRNRHMGIIFQGHNLLEDMTTIENLLMPFKIARTKLTSKEMQKAIDLLTEMGIEDKASIQARFLSGGEKQRLAIARALINDQQIIFADEPTGNLDSENSEKIHKILINAVKKKGITLILATHDKQLANLCDKIYLLENGKLTISKK